MQNAFPKVAAGNCTINRELFEAGNVEQLTERIRDMWSDKQKCLVYSRNCGKKRFVELQ